MSYLKLFRQKILYSPMTYNYKLDFVGFLDFHSEGFNYWMKLSSNDKIKMDVLTSKIYDYVTTIDDVVDNAKIRKGKPTAASLYGHPFTTISTAIFILDVIRDSAKIHPQAPDVITKDLAELFEGTAAEIYHRDFNILPSVEAFKELITAKTAGVIKCQCRLQQLVSENKTDYTAICDGLGLYYQFWNDHLALTDDKHKEGKGFLSDVTEGKFTLPFIHAMNQEEHDPKLINILRQKTEDEELKKFVMSLLVKYDSVEFAKNEIVKVGKKLVQDIKNFGGNPILEKLPRIE